MSVGIEWLVDARGCRAESLRDAPLVRDVLEGVIAALDLRVVGEGTIHKFSGPGGVTALYLLTESHLACHTYPESGIATFNLYCCRARRPYEWQSELARRLGATHVSVTSRARGADEPTERTG